jgi:hypothetical protein
MATITLTFTMGASRCVYVKLASGRYIPLALCTPHASQQLGQARHWPRQDALESSGDRLPDLDCKNGANTVLIFMERTEKLRRIDCQ